MDMLSAHQVHIIEVDCRLGEGDWSGDELSGWPRSSPDREMASISACTSDDSALTRLQCAGADAVLPKPILPDEALIKLGVLHWEVLRNPVDARPRARPDDQNVDADHSTCAGS